MTVEDIIWTPDVFVASLLWNDSSQDSDWFHLFFVARPTCQTHNHTQTDFFTQETAASIHSQGGEEKVWMTGASRGTTDWDFKSLTGTELISNLIQLQ